MCALPRQRVGQLQCMEGRLLRWLSGFRTAWCCLQGRSQRSGLHGPWIQGRWPTPCNISLTPPPALPHALTGTVASPPPPPLACILCLWTFALRRDTLARVHGHNAQHTLDSRACTYPSLTWRSAALVHKMRGSACACIGRTLAPVCRARPALRRSGGTRSGTPGRPPPASG